MNRTWSGSAPTCEGRVLDIIDSHDSGYLGMTVQLYVQGHLGHYHVHLDSEAEKEYSQKLMAQLKSTLLFTYMHNLNF